MRSPPEKVCVGPSSRRPTATTVPDPSTTEWADGTRRDLVLAEGHQAANLEGQPAHEGPEPARPELIRIALEGRGARRCRVHHVDEAVADAEEGLRGGRGPGTP